MKTIIISTVLLLFCLGTKAQLSESTEFFNQALQKMATGDQKEAFSLMQRSVDLLPQYYPTICLADMYVNGLGTPINIEKAKQYYKLVADCVVDDETSIEKRIIIGYACRCYASICMKEGNSNTKLYLVYYEKADNVSNDAYSEYMLGHYYYFGQAEGIPGAIEDKQKGLKYLELSAEKDCIVALSKLATIYNELGDEDKALNYNMKAANLEPYDPTKAVDIYSPLSNPNLTINPYVIESWNMCLYNTGFYLVSEGNAENALSYLKKITMEKPRYRALRGMCYASVGEEAAAKADFEEAVSLDPNNGQTYNTMAIVYSEIWNDKVTAEKYFKKAIALGYKLAEENYKEYILGQ